MNAENFCFWLHGWFELQEPKTITPEQLQEIKNHLDLVFNKVTPVIPKALRTTLEETTYCSSTPKSRKEPDLGPWTGGITSWNPPVELDCRKCSLGVSPSIDESIFIC